MKLTHYELNQNPREAWYGYQRFGCPEAVKSLLKKESQIAKSKGCISEREFEVDCFLSILADIKKLHVNLIEAGAGWGEWCMALAGVVSKKIIPITAKNYFAVGIEGDYSFFEQMVKNFKSNGIKGWPFYAAVSNRGDYGLFNTGFISKEHCGGSMSFVGKFKGSAVGAVALGLANLFTRKTRVVNKYTVDWLIQMSGMFSLDILHIDVQGAECLVLEGAKENIDGGLIDYILVGTHAHNLHMKVWDMLKYSYDAVANAEPGRINHHKDMPPAWIAKGQDGLILFKRKGL